MLLTRSIPSPVSSQDLGLQGTSLNDILYKNAAFLNLVDPISHELLLSLARDLQCPKRVRIQLQSCDRDKIEDTRCMEDDALGGLIITVIVHYSCLGGVV